MRVYNKGITATHAVTDKNLFTEYTFATQQDAENYIRDLELNGSKCAIEYYERRFAK